MASQKFTDIINHINEQETSIDNVTVLIDDLRQEIADGATPEELDALLVELQQNSDKLEEAILTNVDDAEEPADEEPVVDPTEPPVDEEPAVDPVDDTAEPTDEF
jgi:hypothetical protein